MTDVLATSITLKNWAVKYDDALAAVGGPESISAASENITLFWSAPTIEEGRRFAALFPDAIWEQSGHTGVKAGPDRYGVTLTLLTDGRYTAEDLNAPPPPAAKYELTDQTNAAGLRRIRALRDIPRYGVKAGELGGWVGSEKNLSQEGDCWVADNAQVRDRARVIDHSLVGDYALVADDSLVRDYAVVDGNSVVGWLAVVGGDTWIGGRAVVR